MTGQSKISSILKKFLTEKGNDKETAQNVMWFKSNI